MHNPNENDNASCPYHFRNTPKNDRTIDDKRSFETTRTLREMLSSSQCLCYRQIARLTPLERRALTLAKDERTRSSRQNQVSTNSQLQTIAISYDTSQTAFRDCKTAGSIRFSLAGGCVFGSSQASSWPG